MMTIYQPWKRVRTHMGSVSVMAKGWLLEGRDPQTDAVVRQWFPTVDAAQRYASKRQWLTNK